MVSPHQVLSIVLSFFSGGLICNMTSRCPDPLECIVLTPCACFYVRLENIGINLDPALEPVLGQQKIKDQPPKKSIRKDGRQRFHASWQDVACQVVGAHKALEVESFSQDQIVEQLQTSAVEDFIMEKTWYEKGRAEFTSTSITRKVAPKLREIKRVEWQVVKT